MSHDARVAAAKADAVVEAKSTPKAKAEKKSFSIRLKSGAEELTLLASKTPTGWRTEVVTRANKKNTRGMTTDFSTMEAAKGAIEKLAVAAESKGWQRIASKRPGFARPVDAFTTLPAPTKAKKGAA